MFQRSLSLNPDNLRIRNSLAFAYVRLNRFAEAQHHFQEILKRDPLNVTARIGLGMWWSSAMADLQKKSRVSPRHMTVNSSGGRPAWATACLR